MLDNFSTIKHFFNYFTQKHMYTSLDNIKRFGCGSLIRRDFFLKINFNSRAFVREIHEKRKPCGLFLFFSFACKKWIVIVILKRNARERKREIPNTQDRVYTNYIGYNRDSDNDLGKGAIQLFGR